MIFFGYVHTYTIKHLFLGLLFITSFFCISAQTSKPKRPVISKMSSRVFYGLASFYSNKFHGRHTASGELLSQSKLTCACNALPLGTWIKVTNVHNGRSIIVKVNDRLHPKMRRLIDLTRIGAEKLGYIASGVTRVRIEVARKKIPR